MRTLAVSLVLLAMALGACDKNDPAPITIQSSTVSNLAADPPSGGYNPTNGQPIGVTKKYTFFSFKTGAVVANSDSATTAWDLGFNGTTIIVNSGTSGPGSAAAQVVIGLYDELETAPETGYLTDDKNSVSAPYAIAKGSGNGWYNYNPATNVITPIAGRVIVVKTSEGKFAKVEILSYYKDAPASPTSADIDRYYSFQYVFQSGTGNSFK